MKIFLCIIIMMFLTLRILSKRFVRQQKTVWRQRRSLFADDDED